MVGRGDGNGDSAGFGVLLGFWPVQAARTRRRVSRLGLLRSKAVGGPGEPWIPERLSRFAIRKSLDRPLLGLPACWHVRPPKNERCEGGPTESDCPPFCIVGWRVGFAGYVVEFFGRDEGKKLTRNVGRLTRRQREERLARSGRGGAHAESRGRGERSGSRGERGEAHAEARGRGGRERGGSRCQAKVGVVARGNRSGTRLWVGLVHSEARGVGGGEVIHDAVEAFFECGCAEVDEETDGEIHEAEIGEELLGMDRGESLD